MLKQNHPNDWLLSLEIIELAHKTNDQALLEQVIIHLEKVKQARPEIAHLISGGLELFMEKVTL